MRRSHHKHHFSWKKFFRVFLILAIIAGSISLFTYSSPEELITFIGIENIYFLMFFLALIGGISTFTAIPYHLVLITFVAGGANPLLIGLFASFGVMVGDSTSYFIGYQGNKILPGFVLKFLAPVRGFAERHPRVLPFFFFFYGALVPFSNDFIVISMGMNRYPFWKLMIPLGLGLIVFNVTLAYLALNFFDFVNLFL